MMLEKEQIAQLMNDDNIQATIQANKEAVAKKREADLMLLGYNQALLDTESWPPQFSLEAWEKIIEDQKEKLGIDR